MSHLRQFINNANSLHLLILTLSFALLSMFWSQPIFANESLVNTPEKSIALDNTASNSESTLVGSQVTQPSEYFAQITLSLVLVLLIIFVAAWLLRRYGRFPGVAEGNLKVLGALSVGQRERILLLQVGKEQVLVGVTSHKITRLHQLEEPVEVAHNETKSSPFSKKLQEALQPKQDGTQNRENP